MDAIIAMSGFFDASSAFWILILLAVALLAGGLVAGLFGGIFYGMNRLARKASARYPDTRS